MSDETKKYWTDDDELVEKYVLGPISAEEKRRLDEEIAGCEPCREKIRIEMELAAGIKRHGRERMKAHLRTVLRKNRDNQFTIHQYAGLAAAVVVIAVGIGAYKLWFSGPATPEEFQEQEIVLQPEEDTAEIIDEQLSPSESVPENSSADVIAEVKKPEESVKVAAPPPRAEQSTTSAQRAVPAPVRPRPAAGAMAESEMMPEDVKRPVGGSSVWLIGKVVMISGGSLSLNAAEPRMEMYQKADKRMAKEKSAELIPSEKTITLRRVKDEGITLQQRPINDLPSGLAPPRDARVRDVQTLFERSGTGFTLTLFGDAVEESDLQEAVVEKLTNDSLIVLLPMQRIAFRLPSGWNKQPAGR